jgi:hypothetical protein
MVIIIIIIIIIIRGEVEIACEIISIFICGILSKTTKPSFSITDTELYLRSQVSCVITEMR